MPWNDDEKDAKKGGSGWSPKSEQGPPDIFELFKRLSKQFSSGGKKNGGTNAPSFQRIVYIALPLILAAWLFSGMYIINEGQRGIILRFGEYMSTSSPGPHWHIPYPIESVEKVDVDRNRTYQTKARMLTQDENIVEVELATQYRIKNAPDFLFNMRSPDARPGLPPEGGTLAQVMGSSLREIVGKSKMDYILGEGRANIALSTKNLMQEILDDYNSGMEIISVNLQQSQPPQAVQEAFADAIKAREDEVRYKNEAETYANGVVPQARGEAARMKLEASAYREKVVANAQGETQRFEEIRLEYEKSPGVTRKRLYIQTMEDVLRNTNKVIIDVQQGNNVFLLSLDKLAATYKRSSNSERETSKERNSMGGGTGKSTPKSTFERTLREGRLPFQRGIENSGRLR